jgi:hypothetical protein
MRLALIVPLAALYIGLSGGRAGSDTLFRKTFHYATPDRCEIDSDIWFCGLHGGAGTVTLTGDLKAHNFLLTIRGELQPRIKMSGTELVVAKPKAGTDGGETVIVHHIKPGETPYLINETVEVKNSRFSLNEITDVCLQEVANFSSATRC